MLNFMIDFMRKEYKNVLLQHPKRKMYKEYKNEKLLHQSNQTKGIKIKSNDCKKIFLIKINLLRIF